MHERGETSPVKSSPFNKNLATVTHELGSNLYLYLILEETPNGVMVVDFQHQVLYANPAATKFLGAIHRGLTESDLHSALGHQNGEMFRRIQEFIKKPEKHQDFRFRQEIHIETGADEVQILDAVLVYPPSSPGYYLLYLIDITTRKKLEGKLRRRNAFFHNLIESSVDGIIASDMKGTLIILTTAPRLFLAMMMMKNSNCTSLVSTTQAWPKRSSSGCAAMITAAKGSFGIRS